MSSINSQVVSSQTQGNKGIVEQYFGRKLSSQLAWLTSIVTAIALILFGSYRYNQQEKFLAAELEVELLATSRILAASLSVPIFNYDNYAAETILRAMFNKKEILTVSIDDVKEFDLSFTRNELGVIGPGPLASSTPSILTRQGVITHKNEAIGNISISVTDEYMRASLESTRDEIIFQLIALELLLVIPILILLRFRFIYPIERLTHMSAQITQGDLNQTESLSRNDELGELEHSLFEMRDSIRDKIIGLNKEIAERQRIETQLAQAHKMEAIGTMAGGIAHDFNNILAIIVGHAELALIKSDEENPSQKHINQVLTAGNRAIDLVSQILSYSRLSIDEKTFKPIQLAPILSEVLKFQRSIMPTSIVFKTHIDNDCGTISGDPTQVHQIMMNFFTNALHAMETSGGILDISLQNTDLAQDDINEESEAQPGAYIMLSVQDTGSGLSPDIIDKIFDPYFTTKEVGKGTGMGLSVVQGIVSSHGGFIKVDSQLGVGSTFRVYLPLINKNSEVSEPNTLEIPKGDEQILIVDDEEMLTDSMKTFLESLGYTVTVQTNSLEAWRNFRTNPYDFDVIITDQTMPNLSGAELSEKILKLRPKTPIILNTGYSSSIDKEMAQKIGIREFIAKPVSNHHLAALIRKVLSQTSQMSSTIRE